jgi:hypothetical protein
MKRILLTAIAAVAACTFIAAQKIVPIEYNGKKYEVLDMTAKGKVTWGGFEEVPADAAKSEYHGHRTGRR